jgi:hypothetical protein
MFEYQLAELTIQQIDPGLRLYEVQGQYMFPVYGVTGGVTSKRVAYLYKPRALRTMWVLAFWIPLDSDGEAEMLAAAHKFNTHMRPVDMDNDEMGLPPLEKV